MKKNLMLALCLITAVFSSSPLQLQKQRILQSRQEQEKLSNNYPNLILGFIFGSIAVHQAYKCKQEKELDDIRWEQWQRRNPIPYKRYRTFAAAASIVSGLFFYKAVAGFMRKS